jgi:uncharacterized protein YdaU (DUF1376 family)
MAISDFPWFKIYAAETLSDEHFISWDATQRGIWITLLCHAWKEGSIPADVSILARLCGVDAQAMPGHFSGIAHRFLPHCSDPKRLICPRLEFERQQALEESARRSTHGAKGANARWQKVKQGMPGHSPGSAQPMPTDAPKPKNKEVPPKAPKGASKRRSKVEQLEPFSEAVREVINALMPIWRQEDPEDHRPIRCNAEEAAIAVDAILQGNPNVTPEMLIKAGREYCTSTRMRYKAIQYFFGPQGQWSASVRASLTRLDREAAHA